MHSTPSSETVVTTVIETKKSDATRHAAGPPRVGDTLLLDLALIDDNPFQPRKQMDMAKLHELASSIAQRGLLQPIAVRPKAPGRYELIAGGRRTAAFRMLLAAAKTESERRKYALIRAHVVAAVTDSQMALAAYDENAKRADLTPLEEAMALACIPDLGANLSATEVAKLTSQPERRVRRLLRLFDAPDVVKQSVGDGVLVEVNDPGEPERRERRRLDLIAALEFARLHEHCLRTRPGTADARTASAVERALRESWTLRRIRGWVDGVVSGTKATAETAAAESTSPAENAPDGAAGPTTAAAAAPDPAELTTTSPVRFVLNLAKLPAATANQLRAARAALEAVLDAVDDQLSKLPAEPKQP